MQADTFIEKKEISNISFQSEKLDFEMIIINFLFAFKMVHSKVFDEIAKEKRMVPMFESTVPVSSLVNYY